VRADAVVVAYRSAAVLPACLRGLRADPTVDRIVVVNNSQDDDTAAVVGQVEGTVFVQQPANVGFSRAVNAARPHLGSPFVVLANPDAAAAPGTVTAAVGFLRAHPGAGVVGPRIVVGDGRLYRSSQRDLSLGRLAGQALLDRRPRLGTTLARLGLDGAVGLQRSERRHRASHPTEYVIGSFAVCRRDALDRLGWFDESIFLFGEDQDLCRRMRRAGWEVWYAPVGEVVHTGGHSWRQLSDRGRALFHQARHRELARSRNRASAELYRLAYRLRRVRTGRGATR
jgi:N-acetylglucosaminyl-diphospho-decaprenol L-rhamnosyltransferase